MHRAIAIASLLALPVWLRAQSFDAASIKAVQAPEPGRGFSSRHRGGPGTADPGLYTCTNCPFLILVEQAYGLPDYLVTGLETVGDHLYDVSARVPVGATKEQFLLMFQNLLGERFKLTTRFRNDVGRRFDTPRRHGKR
jgi:uncharacterized protein (TIGR03435 family)